MESLLQGATRLFAALGYDATTLKQIADSTGLDPAEEGFGVQADLYLAVIERAARIETEELEGVINEMMTADQVTGGGRGPRDRRPLHRLLRRPPRSSRRCGYTGGCTTRPTSRAWSGSTPSR